MHRHGDSGARNGVGYKDSFSFWIRKWFRKLHCLLWPQIRFLGGYMGQSCRWDGQHTGQVRSIFKINGLGASRQARTPHNDVGNGIFGWRHATKLMFLLGFPIICEIYLVLAPSKAPPKPGCCLWNSIMQQEKSCIKLEIIFIGIGQLYRNRTHMRDFWQVCG